MVAFAPKPTAFSGLFRILSNAKELILPKGPRIVKDRENARGRREEERTGLVLGGKR